MQYDISFAMARAFPLRATEVRIEWELMLTAMPLDRFRFRVLRSGQINGPFETVAENLSPNSRSFVDTSATLTHRVYWPLWFVEIYDPADTWSKRSSAIELSRMFNRMALKIISMEYNYLARARKGYGIECVLHSIKQWGPRCPVCWDSVKMKMTKSNCATCYGTGYAGGYYDPVTVWLRYSAPQKSVKVSDQGQAETEMRQAWTIPSPEIHSNDVIIDPMLSKAYRIVDANSHSEVRGGPMRQFLQLKLLIRGSVEYKLLEERRP